MAKKGQKFDKHDLELILSIVKLKLEEGKSYLYLSKKYNISKGTIKTWVFQYRKHGSLGTRTKGRPKQDENTDYKEKYEILKKYMEFLEEVDREKK